MALGAKQTQIFWYVMRRALLLYGIGCVVGLLLTRACDVLIASLLFGVHSADPVVIGSALTAILAVSLIAAWIPARRALQISPMAAIRHE